MYILSNVFKGGKLMAKKVLVLGATGAMGQYLVPRLADMGYEVDAVSLDDVTVERPNLKYIKANAKDKPTFHQFLSKRYDGIVDFMIYTTNDLSYYLPAALDHTDHYIYLSSYRAYDNKQVPVTESAPLLCDTADDLVLRHSDDYSVFKGRGEHVIRALGKSNWTIIRPAITYSKMRYQLVTLEAPNTVGRAFAGKATVLPVEARDVQGTMSWAGDVAQMIAGLLFNERALCEAFSVCTAEHHPWHEVAEYYEDICGLKTVWVDKEDYLKIISPDKYARWARWQLDYDRLFDRVMDNSKVLEVTGMKQENLMKLYDGLKYEIGRCPRDFQYPVNTAMDAYLESRG
jgi:nucleoside-diphosphate-sugar epimerase